MVTRIEFHEVALQELNQAFQYYEGEKLGLGVDFLDFIDEKINMILLHPLIFPIVEKPIRKAVLRKFPYTIYYEIFEDVLYVLAIHHQKKNPTSWQSRIN